MLKMTDDTEHPSNKIGENGAMLQETLGAPDFPKDRPPKERGLIDLLKGLIGQKPDPTLRETIEEYVEGQVEEDEEAPSVSAHEKTLISNVLDLRDMSAADIMVPRADIVAVSDETTQEELLRLLSEKQYSRIPVYKDTLDHVIGALHAKDMLAALAQKKKLIVSSIMRDLPIVSPSMPLLDLLLQMRQTRKHLVMVIDEFGGIDGLVTIGDVIEAIVGEIDDEHDPEDHPQISILADDKVIADARYDLNEFEEHFGQLLNDEEREDCDTLGGLVFSMAGRVPARGEVLTHKPTGMVFEILDAGPRRINRLRILNIPQVVSQND